MLARLSHVVQAALRVGAAASPRQYLHDGAAMDFAVLVRVLVRRR